jgi:hypothetical protein
MEDDAQGAIGKDDGSPIESAYNKTSSGFLKAAHIKT